MTSIFLSSAKSFASKFSNDRSIPLQLETSTGVEVKFYTSQSTAYSALFAVVSMGAGPTALQIINVYGQFDFEEIGGSTNLPPEMLSSSATTVSVITNPLIKQFIAYKEDDAGKLYFSNGDNSPPPCDKFNYCFMIFGDNSGSFGIKSSKWKVGDKDIYEFKLSDLTPIDMETFSQPASWCKSPLPLPLVDAASSTVASNSRASDREPVTWIIVALISVLVLLLVLIKMRKS